MVKLLYLEWINIQIEKYTPENPKVPLVGIFRQVQLLLVSLYYQYSHNKVLMQKRYSSDFVRYILALLLLAVPSINQTISFMCIPKAASVIVVIFHSECSIRYSNIIFIIVSVSAFERCLIDNTLHLHLVDKF